MTKNNSLNTEEGSVIGIPKANRFRHSLLAHFTHGKELVGCIGGFMSGLFSTSANCPISTHCTKSSSTCCHSQCCRVLPQSLSHEICHMLTSVICTNRRSTQQPSRNLPCVRAHMGKCLWLTVD